MKQIIVNVSGLSTEEKQRVNEALAKIMGLRMCALSRWDLVATMYGSPIGRTTTQFEYQKHVDPTHTPQEVLEMVEKRKVRKDFDPTKEYSVDVSNCTEDEKKKVQQAFFDAGFPWEVGGKKYRHLDAEQYTNTTGDGHVTKFCMYARTTEDCNMNPDEFFSYVYEPVQQSHPHADEFFSYVSELVQQGHVHTVNMPLYAEDAKTGEHNMSNTEFLPQIVQLPQVRDRLKALIPFHELIHLLPFREDFPPVDVLVQKAKEVNLLDHLKLEYTADRVEVYMKVGEIEG